MKDTLAFMGERTSRLISGTYILMAVRSPSVFKFIYKAGGTISSDKHKSFVYLANKSYAENLYRYIKKNGFDTVIASHLFPAEALTCLRKTRKLPAKCYAIATDYTCVPFWEETDLDYYFIPHKDLEAEFVERGVKREKLVPTGIPVPRKFSSKQDRAEARKALGFEQMSRIFLIMTGSMGYGKVTKLTDRLLAAGDAKTKVVILGGNNRKMKRELRSRFIGDGRVLILDYTDRVNDYMDAADVLFTKPGGLTSTEAAVKNIPLVHTAPIPGCETSNLRFFSDKGISASSPDTAGLVQKAYELAEDGQVREKMLEAQRREINSRAGEDICDFIIEHAEAADARK